MNVTYDNVDGAIIIGHYLRKQHRDGSTATVMELSHLLRKERRKTKLN